MLYLIVLNSNKTITIEKNDVSWNLKFLIFSSDFFLLLFDLAMMCKVENVFIFRCSRLLPVSSTLLDLKNNCFVSPFNTNLKVNVVLHESSTLFDLKNNCFELPFNPNLKVIVVLHEPLILFNLKSVICFFWYPLILI